MSQRNYKLFNNWKALTLNYIAFSVGTAFQALRDDLSKTETSKELRVIRAYWSLAAHKFRTDMTRSSTMIKLTGYGTVSRYDEYKYFLAAADKALKDKETSLSIKK